MERAWDVWWEEMPTADQVWLDSVHVAEDDHHVVRFTVRLLRDGQELHLPYEHTVEGVADFRLRLKMLS